MYIKEIKVFSTVMMCVYVVSVCICFLPQLCACLLAASSSQVFVTSLILKIMLRHVIMSLLFDLSCRRYITESTTYDGYIQSILYMYDTAYDKAIEAARYHDHA